MPSPRHIALALALLGLLACRKDGAIPEAELAAELTRTIERSTGGSLADLRFPAEGDLDAIPQDPRNPLTAEKVALGKLLFHETGLSRRTLQSSLRGTVSCATCHNARAGFQSGRAQGIGEGGEGFGESGEARALSTSFGTDFADVQAIRTPSVLNVAYQRQLHWNGQFGSRGDNAHTEAQWTEGTPRATNTLGYEGPETQAIAGLAIHRMAVDLELLEALGYTALFDAAFGDVAPDDRYSATTTGLAIAAYERALLPTRSPWQSWLAGEALAMSAAELRGATLFFGDAGCVDCHAGPALSSEAYYALGMSDLDQHPGPVVAAGADANANKGRGGFTQRSGDLYKFKVPQLYNLADAPHYGHGASFQTLAEVVAYKASAVAQNERVGAQQLSSEFRPLHLSAAEQADLVAFLQNGLRDPALERYVPTALPSGSAFPAADVVSLYETAATRAVAGVRGARLPVSGPGAPRTPATVSKRVR